MARCGTLGQQNLRRQTCETRKRPALQSAGDKANGRVGINITPPGDLTYRDGQSRLLAIGIDIL
eukprot:1638791-Lingulodinium_polyedra.AAC.1